ncbi:transcription factor IIA, alpha/beta subunit [Dictyocaulus viviparus]|uniref:Transcription factor IIA, alpha/beta subunit n=1 Tax=Dictyocaulus viviparus TaxID=29172 RepID=A0A0D8XRT9_DICVI|nr:transcription factor IIA, alpha/beta subunit [Dictyocaulus viviparus]
MAEIYKGVIQDVISQVKEAFLDENVDIDVLSQLKKEWEDKVIASGCVDMEPRHVAHQVAPPPLRPHVMQPRMGTVTQVRLQAAPQIVSQSHPNIVNHIEQPRPMQMQYVPQQGMQQIQVQQVQHGTMPTGVTFTPQGSVRMVQAIQSQPGQQYVIAQGGQQLQPGVMFLQQANGQHIPVTVGPSGVLQHRIQPSHGGHQLHQLDGNGSLGSVDFPCSSKISAHKSLKRVMKNKRDEEALNIARNLLMALHLDGGAGGGMSDSSSEEDEVDDDDDPIRRIADRIGDGQIDDGEQAIVEEDPLNSGDDQSDDEDLETLFDADNVIMCQFEKVHRARSKWKFQLKDGIMHIDNKDYCFQKCSGEAEW